MIEGLAHELCEPNCRFCTHSQQICQTCGIPLAWLTTNCPGYRLSEALRRKVFSGFRNFVTGLGWLKRDLKNGGWKTNSYEGDGWTTLYSEGGPPCI